MTEQIASEAEESALEIGCGVVDVSARTRLDVVGEDRAAFLHNFCTNDVRGLAEGSGVEALCLDARGHVRFHVSIVARPEGHLLCGSPGVGESLRRHLERYIIRERVALVDRTADWGELLIAGKHSTDVLGRVLNLPLPSDELQNVATPQFGDAAFLLRNVMTTAANYSLIVPRAAFAEARRRLIDAGAAACSTAAIEPVRIAAGFPEAPADFTDKTLAQELNRDRRLLNFRKGCYLGQETVARLDALGHVNRLLVGLRSSDVVDPAMVPSPPTSVELRLADRKAGLLTSVAYSPRRRRLVALAYVGVDFVRPGTRLSSDAGDWEVTELPAADVAAT